MNSKTFIDELNRLVTRIYQYVELSESISDIKAEIYEFLDQYYETYLNSSPEERDKIRKLVKKHHTSNETPNLLDLFLIGYVQRTSEKIKLTGDKTWLTRGLVVSSIEDSIRDQRDNTTSLAYLYVTAEEKNLNPKSEFQATAEISNKEISSGGTISMSELMINIPDIAQKTYNDWIKYR